MGLSQFFAAPRVGPSPHRSELRWPKVVPVLTPEQERIREDFVQHWLEILPKRYNCIEQFNHRYALPRKPSVPSRTLEVGGGTGTHLDFEDLTDQEYTVLELRKDLAQQISIKHPHTRVMVGDVQERIDAPDQWFDRVLAIHVLEHLPNLPSALKEIKRVMKSEAFFYAVVPCEGGWAYERARNFSARRLFEKRYRCSYDWFVKSEHMNNVWEILKEVSCQFRNVERSYWPLRVPFTHLNLVIGLTCIP
jgi:SAM-dependent methyltransferase